MTKQYGTVFVENLSESNYGPSQIMANMSRALRVMPSASNSAAPIPQPLADDDCCYRLRTLRILTEDRRTWEIHHWQYLAWGDHGKAIHRFRFFKMNCCS